MAIIRSNEFNRPIRPSREKKPFLLGHRLHCRFCWNPFWIRHRCYFGRHFIH
ncbi:hypothetical protein CbuK_0544 [Coxiella burnetii CbuK_Q154]|nr:hypothetical protein CbuK_0544 [Coxiella burnetii CbuK_Q154]